MGKRGDAQRFEKEKRGSEIREGEDEAIFFFISNVAITASATQNRTKKVLSETFLLGVYLHDWNSVGK